ncbi:hypothetical protein AS850_07520 [Frondihabitans sp. 762G35]|uniref:hypothetical protein n=1 Tax=Frondihabitans sp. 762G35 TaxID=1446794 RepID=UPI000D203279|nr:hypothetical protein [Frondihabitans sp. 762G35]ARC56925.1 hypothetical protein AS850_07520 [Frondihabitans sp. 762G35]
MNLLLRRTFVCGLSLTGIAAGLVIANSDLSECWRLVGRVCSGAAMFLGILYLGAVIRYQRRRPGRNP